MELNAKDLHAYLDRLASRCLPFLDRFHFYRWSVWQIELATDVVFKTAEDLHPVYDHLVRSATCTVC